MMRMQTRVYYDESGAIIKSEGFVRGPDGKDLIGPGDHITVDFDYINETLLDYVVENGDLKKKPDNAVDLRRYEEALMEVLDNRARAYKNESDPLYIESEFNGDTDKYKWKDKVVEIKLRFPKPKEPK